MTSLSPKARALLATDTHAPGPSSDARARMKAGVLGAVAAGATTAAAETATATAAGAGTKTATVKTAVAKAATTTAVKTGATAAAVAETAVVGGLPKGVLFGLGASTLAKLGAGAAAIAALAVVATQSQDPVTTPPPPAASTAPTSRAPTTAHQKVTPRTSARPAERSAPAPSAAVGLPDAPPTPTRPEASSATLHAQTQLLMRARIAVRDGHHAEAMQLLDRYRTTYGDGALAEERDALLAIATCRRDLSQGPAAARGFARRHPTSPLRARVAQACAVKK